MTVLEPLPRSAAPVDPDPGTVPERPVSFPSLRVNLLPPEVVLARRARRARRVVSVSLAVLVVVLAAATFVARAGVGAQRDELAAATAVNTNLVAQQSRYADVVAAQAAVAAAHQRTRNLTVTDVGWAALTRAVFAAAPTGLTVTGVVGQAAVPDVAPAAPAAPAVPTTGAATPATPVATLTVTGSAADPTVVALLVDRLAATTGLAAVAATSVDLVDAGGYAFTVAADVTAAALAPRAGTGTGS